MQFDYEEFINKKFCILTNSSDEFDTIKSYYKIAAGTVDRYNRATHPYIFANTKGVHGSASGFSLGEVVKFPDWVHEVFYTEPDYELEESEYDISYLMA